MNSRNVPFFSLSEQTNKIKPAVMAAFEKIVDTQQFIGGSSIEQVEQKLAAYLGVKHVISCNSGTDALWIAVHALNVQPNDIVLTTPFSFIASSSELIPHRAHPVFIDVDPVTFNLCPQKLAQWLEENAEMRDGSAVHRGTGYNIVGIIPVHLFGHNADMHAISAIAAQYNLWIIEDTAQAIGTTLDGRMAGTVGTVGTFSFYPTKNLGAFGDAGCVVTNDTALAEKLLRLRNHGRKSHYHYEGYGLNSRMDALQAEVISIKIDHVESYNAARRAIAHIYNEQLAHVPFLTLPTDVYGTHTYHQYSVVIKPELCGMTRDQVADYLASRGIGTRVFYPQSLQEIDYLQTSAALHNPCPRTAYLTSNILALPIWPELSHELALYVCDVLKELGAVAAANKEVVATV